MPIYRATVRGKNYEAMADLVRRHRLPIAGHSVKALARGAYRVQVHATGAQLRTLEREGYGIRRHEEIVREGRKRQRENVRAARQRAAGALKVAGLDHYLDVDAIEAAIEAVARPPNDAFVRRIALPHATWENRTCHALEIGHGGGASRPGIYLLGGVHAREWGSPDILVNFVQQVTAAYAGKTGVTIGPRRFTAAQIASIIETKTLCVFPQANPDGRHHSMAVEANWRKNRRPAPGGKSKPSCVGVDLNRNFDFLWDFSKHFDPAAPIANSTDPCDHDVYVGPAPASEPETRNVVALLDAHPEIRYFIDIHSYGEDILCSWGDDEDQTTNAAMNFRNPAYDGKRGVSTDSKYKEYIPGADRKAATALGRAMRDAIAAVRGRTYTVEPSFSLYPTAGTSDDFAYSRHFTDPTRPRVYAYTIEWGRETNATPFHPPYSEMKRIIQEVTAGLIQFCLKAG